ncbi:MAG: DUF3343 domain-containing protein [Firmicutes bacterium]|nr:DUF3343 domain-containing protein [Bacillota bacterium]
MYCLAIVDSGNYAYRLYSIMRNKGYDVEVVSTPCKLAKSGCSYCIKLPFEYKDLIVKEGLENNIYVREIYKVTTLDCKNVYERIK